MLTQVGGEGLGDHVADLLSKISVQAAIMPNHLSMNNKAVMEYHTGDDEAGDEDIYNGDIADDIKPGFFKLSNTENYFADAKLEK